MNSSPLPSTEPLQGPADVKLQATRLPRLGFKSFMLFGDRISELTLLWDPALPKAST